MEKDELEERCGYCANEPEPGFIEMDNNGPILRCPVCERRSHINKEGSDNV